MAKLIQALQKIEENGSAKPDNETKYKYLTSNNIEIGSVYDSISKEWQYYLKIPHAAYNQNTTGFDAKELRTLIKLLNRVEQAL